MTHPTAAGESQEETFPGAVKQCLALVFENLDLHIQAIEAKTKTVAISSEDWQFLNGYKKARKDLWDACFPVSPSDTGSQSPRT